VTSLKTREGDVIGINWAHASPSILAVFPASLVEFVEALAVVSAAGSMKVARAAMTVTVFGCVFLKRISRSNDADRPAPLRSVFQAAEIQLIQRIDAGNAR
jgi:hypothetical protein